MTLTFNVRLGITSLNYTLCKLGWTTSSLKASLNEVKLIELIKSLNSIPQLQLLNCHFARKNHSKLVTKILHRCRQNWVIAKPLSWTASWLERWRFCKPGKSFSSLKNYFITCLSIAKLWIFCIVRKCFNLSSENLLPMKLSQARFRVENQFIYFWENVAKDFTRTLCQVSRALEKTECRLGCLHLMTNLNGMVFGFIQFVRILKYAISSAFSRVTIRWWNSSSKNKATWPMNIKLC